MLAVVWVFLIVVFCGAPASDCFYCPLFSNGFGCCVAAAAAVFITFVCRVTVVTGVADDG